MSNNCSLTTCRYNKDRKCTNEEKRKECVKVSSAVLCLDCDSKQKKNIKFDICNTNQNCENDQKNCGYAVEYSTLEDAGNGIHKYMCGRDKCKYCK